MCLVVFLPYQSCAAPEPESFYNAGGSARKYAALVHPRWRLINVCASYFLTFFLKEYKYISILII